MNRLPDPMVWLEHRVPLTLLIDLLSEDGPASSELYLTESADTQWVTTAA